MHPVFYGQGIYQPLLDLLCHEFRIITTDPRGAGGSDPLPPVYTLRDHVEDTRAVIEGAGDRPVVFVGMSRAAALGVVLATTYPHLVEKLVLIGTPPAPSATPDCPGIDQEFWQQVVGMIEAGDYARAIPFFWAREFSDPDSRDLVTTFVQASLEMPRQVFKVFFTAPDPGRDIRHLLPAVRVPTLVLHGEEDRIVPVQAGRWVARQIPGAEFYAFKGCGHMPAFTAPAEFARVVCSFLRTGRAI
jgi:pimeloyl-ACP methyl ester carboxylesterase